MIKLHSLRLRMKFRLLFGSELPSKYKEAQEPSQPLTLTIS